MTVKKRAELPKPAHARLDRAHADQLVVSNPFNVNSVEPAVLVAENKILEHRVGVVKSCPDPGWRELLNDALKLCVQGVGQDTHLM